MLLNEVFFTILIAMLSDFNKVLAKGHGHGRGHGGSSHSSSLSSSHSSGLSSIQSHHTSNSGSRSSTRRKSWSSDSSDEYMASYTKEAVTYKPLAYDYSSVNYKPSNYKRAKYSHYVPPQGISVNGLDDYITSKSYSINRYSNQLHQPPIVVPTSVENRHNDDRLISYLWQISENRLKPYSSSNFESLNHNIPPKEISNSFRVDCEQQQVYSEHKKYDEIIDSVTKICKPSMPVTARPNPITSSSTITKTTPTPISNAKVLETPLPTSKPHAIKEKRYERIIVATPRGINCRKVMNSEFNELGQIVDSVYEVCDPPPTTTTTTTKTPSTKTTPRRPTTTPKPLVKICRRIMDSYLNEVGEIIDSVAELCSMEPKSSFSEKNINTLSSNIFSTVD